MHCAVPLRVQEYLEAIVGMCAGDAGALVSVILFGSAALGGWSETVSDVDLMLVVPDGATEEQIGRLRRKVEGIERLHGLRSGSEHQPGFERFLDRITAHDRTFFICTRGDLLSGDIGRILRIHPLQAMCVDRIVLANMVASGVTLWGEAMLSRVPVPRVRRVDVFKALFSQLPMALLAALIFPLYPRMTRYAMTVLKSAVHSCFFCYERRRASLQEEIGFLEGPLGPNRALIQLLELRREYRDSFAFVARSIPTLLRLHWRTAIDNRFPWKV